MKAMRLVRYFILISALYFASATALANELAHVVFFGGYGTTDAQMKQWAHAAAEVAYGPTEKGAQGRFRYADNFDFEAVTLPSGHSEQAAVVADGEAVINEWVAKIDRASRGTQFVLVGHSSGAAISNQIAKRIADKTKIKLVVLDGYVPHGLSTEVSWYCWSAVATAAPSGEITSTAKTARNTATMMLCPNYNQIKVSGCTDSMCLHFGLVNLNAAKVGVNSQNFKTKGYEQIQPNLVWLNMFFKVASPPAKNASGSSN